jgi:ABC-type nitrate/sulfonate/bicarbonate transport system permease component
VATVSPAAATQRSPRIRIPVLQVGAAKVIFIVVLLLAWQLAAAGGRLGAVPIPTDVAAALIGIFLDGSVWVPLGVTLASWALSFAISSGLGIVVGFPLGASRLAYRMSVFVLDFCRTIPALALVPLAVLLFGTSIQSTVLLASFGAVWAVLLQTVYGVRDVDPVARDTGMPHHTRFVHVPRMGAMQDAPVVPHRDVADGPLMLEQTRRPAGPCEQLLEHRLRLVVVHAGHAVHVSADEQ